MRIVKFIKRIINKIKIQIFTKYKICIHNIHRPNLIQYSWIS